MPAKYTKLSWGRTALCVLVVVIAACSRQQSDWEKARTTNSIESYDQFLKKYPSGEFTAQAQARVKELTEEGDWQKARDADTPDAYQAFLKQYPDGKWAEEARIRVENFSLAQTPAGTPANSDNTTAPASGAGSTPPAGADAQTESASDEAAPPPAKASKPAVAARSKSTSKSASASVPAAAASATATRSSGSSHHGASGAYAVQLGAFRSGAAAAEHAWAKLEKRHPSMLRGVKHRVAPRTVGKSTLYRLQAIELSRSRAHSICAALKAKSQSCILIAPRLVTK